MNGRPFLCGIFPALKFWFYSFGAPRRFCARRFMEEGSKLRKQRFRKADKILYRRMRAAALGRENTNQPEKEKN